MFPCQGGAFAKVELVRAVRLAVIGAIIVAVLLVAVPLILQATAQPKIALTEVSMPEIRFCSDDQEYFFTLVNTGDADGFANIAFSLDGVVVAHQVYFVPAGSSIEKSFVKDPNDCFRHNASMEIEVSWKA